MAASLGGCPACGGSEEMRDVDAEFDDLLAKVAALVNAAQVVAETRFVSSLGYYPVGRTQFLILQDALKGLTTCTTTT